MEREFQYDAIPGLHIYQDETGGFVVIKNHGEVRPILDNGAVINTWKLREVGEFLIALHDELHPAGDYGSEEVSQTYPEDEIPF